jgi:hypothetical protein
MRPPEPKITRLQEWALRLNRRQIRALAVGASLCALFALRPYWYFIRFNEVGGKSRVPAGFHVISSPPVYGSEYFQAEAHIDWIVFLIIEAVCIGGTTAFVLVLRDKNSEASATYGQYR